MMMATLASGRAALDRDPEPMTIVVADDDVDQVEEIAEFLTYRGYRVVGAHDGLAAIEMIEKHRPRIALIDVNMPHYDGIRVAEIAENFDHKMAVVLISGDSAAVVRANQAHVNPFAVVEKPVPLNHIGRFVDAVHFKDDDGADGTAGSGHGVR